MIFSIYERTDPKPARYGESAYQFYNRCSSPAVQKIRSELEKWLNNYTPEYRDELVRRFQTEFDSAFYELLIHELFIRQGAKVIIHPDIGSKGKHPDFEIQVTNISEKVILEATLCLDEEEEDDRNSRKMKQVYDAIESIPCTWCFILIRNPKIKSNKQPSSHRIKSFLIRELKHLDPEMLLQSVTSYTDLPCLHFEDDIIAIDFYILPKKREVRELPYTCNIGSLPIMSRWGDSTKAVRRTLQAKAKHYGNLRQPFIIAVNMLSHWLYDEKELFEALFGTRQEYITVGSEQLHIRDLRDGFWGTSDNSKYTRVSAIIFGCALPVNVPRVNFRLYSNPWAKYPLPTGFWKLPTMTFAQGKIVHENLEVTPGQFFRLPHDWPGDLFPNRRSKYKIK